jgi:hypothetical protein
MPINLNHTNSTISTSTGPLTIGIDSAVRVPVGSQSSRPSGLTGHLRFDTDTGKFEGYNGTQWEPVAGSIDSTTDLAEGTNKYYTDERVDDRVADLLVPGTNVTLTYNDAAGTITLDAISDYLPLAGGTLTGDLTVPNIVVSGAVDGRDVATDGTKLDTIDTNADVTPAWVPAVDPGYLTSQSSYIVTESDVTAHQAALTITESQISDLGTYETADATILKDADIGVNVQAYNANYVVDASYVATDQNFTNADHTKLDGIEPGATSDQTKADIDALNIDAGTLDGQAGSYYTDYTDTAVSGLVDAAPGTLDTLNELAAALGDDPNFATTVTSSIADKLPLAGGTISGNLDISAGSTPQVILNNTDGTSNNSHDFRIGTFGGSTPYWSSLSLDASSIQFKTFTASRVTIDGDGNVGIGTSSPVAKFDLRGNASIGPTNTADTFQGLSFVHGKDSSVANTASYIDFKNNLSTTDAHIFVDHITDGNSVITFGTTSAGSRSIDRRVERMRIDGSGNVGIGTNNPDSTPSTKLHIREDDSTDYRARAVVQASDQRLVLGSHWQAGVSQFSYVQATNDAETVAHTLSLNPDGGAVTMPYQPCFSASGSGILAWSSGSTLTKIIPMTYVPHNVGGHFSASTYRFTAPVAGNYFFAAKATQTGPATGPSLIITKNGAVYGFEMAIGYSVAYHSVGGEAIVPLAAGDYVDMRITNNNSVAMNIDLNRCSLSGFLIG